ncbi:MAG TPA: SIMPL domain-containing protein [Rhizomicrobium sp.]|nr:SIMPL domain-containing protein [Rhizomicrobium sp.]
MPIGKHAALTACVIAIATLPQIATAQPVPSRLPHVLSVSGEGEVHAIPDQAQLSAGVVSHGKTAAEALSANAAAMNTVFATLRKRGIPEKSITTSNFSLSPQYPPYRQDAPQGDRTRIIGYEVSNQVTVILDDVAKAGATLDALVTSGANQAGGVSFTIRDSKPLLAQARTAAVNDAVAKAQTLAKAAGVTLGPILSIQEGGSDAPMPRPMMMRADMMKVASAPTSIAAGEQSVTAHVSITWEIQ